MMPPASARILEEAIARCEAPAELGRLGSILLSYFRTSPCPATDDLGHRLRDAAIRAADFHEFTTLAATKRYTNAHIRRSLWHRYFGITSADLAEPPLYTQILGMNAKGRTALRRASKLATIALLTKPADARTLDPKAAQQAERSQRADLLYPLAMPRAVAGNAGILASPYRKD
jgi:predicted nucleotidyltransferase